MEEQKGKRYNTEGRRGQKPSKGREQIMRNEGIEQKEKGGECKKKDKIRKEKTDMKKKNGAKKTKEKWGIRQKKSGKSRGEVGVRQRGGGGR